MYKAVILSSLNQSIAYVNAFTVAAESVYTYWIIRFKANIHLLVIEP